MASPETRVSSPFRRLPATLIASLRAASDPLHVMAADATPARRYRRARDRVRAGCSRWRHRL